MRRARGFALLVVLWTLPLLALLGIQVAASGRAGVRLTANLRRAAQAEAAADGAVHEAIFHLADGSWIADGVPRRLRVGAATVEMRLRNQAGLLNPNRTAQPVLASLLVDLGIAPDRATRLAQAMQDWRVPAPDPAARAALYRAAGLVAAPTSEDFRSVPELGLVVGMTPDVLAAIAPYVSVYQDFDPDPAWADPLVTKALRAEGIARDRSSWGDPATRPLVVDIVASAAVDDGHFARRALVRLAPVDASSGLSWRMLTWESIGL